MKWNIPLHSLRLKLSLLFSLLMGAISTILIGNSYLIGRDILLKESTTRFDSTVQNLSFNAEYGVLTKNMQALDQLLKGILRDKDVNYVKISDEKGIPLSEIGLTHAPFYSVSSPIMTMAISDQDIDPFWGTTEEDMELSNTLPNDQRMEQIGESYIEFSTLATQKRLQDIRRRAIFLSVLSMLLSSFITYFLIHWMIQPLRDLVSATRRVARGELGVTVKGNQNDEIGELATSFNTMTLNLKNSTVSRDFLDTILDSIPDSIIVANPDDTIQLVNQGTLNLSGYREKELVGKPISEIVSLEQSFYIAEKGENIPVSISEGIIRNLEGELKGTVYVVHDLRPINKLQERLVQSEKMAAVGQLAAGVSHEINNPLGVILGFAQGLVRRITPGSRMENPLKSIEREAMRCKDLVQDLLTFSRSSHADKIPMDINHAVEGALSLIHAQARMDKAEVKQDLTKNLPKVLGNKNQIQQVIINLAKNAMDAMPNGGIVNVTTELILDKIHSWVSLKVIDNGTGIPSDVLPRIFEPFYTTKSVGKGTGLGLSLVYEIIKKHSGTLEVQSRPGYTEFSIKLPARTGREIKSQEIHDPLNKLKKGFS